MQLFTKLEKIDQTSWLLYCRVMGLNLDLGEKIALQIQHLINMPKSLWYGNTTQIEGPPTPESPGIS